MAREEGFFDELARGLADGSISRRGALKLIAGTAIAALIPSRALAQQQKVTICHKPGTPAEKTMEVPQSAVDGHLGHGDHRGPCETETTTTTAAPTTTTSTSTTSTSTTTPMCLPNGATCSTGGTPCCSGNCDSGFCVPPPTGPRRVTCFCNDSAAISLCSSDCSNAARVEVCSPLCESHGGLDIASCFANDPACPPA